MFPVVPSPLGGFISMECPYVAMPIWSSRVFSSILHRLASLVAMVRHVVHVEWVLAGNGGGANVLALNLRLKPGAASTLLC